MPAEPSLQENSAPEPGPVEFSDLINPPKERTHHRVLPWLPNWIKNELVAMMAEFTGTVLFLMFAFGATNVVNLPVSTTTGGTADVNSTGPNASTLLYISLAFGFSLTVNAWVFYRISGGLFNPAVSFALALIGSITWLRAILLTVSQILGGITAAAIVRALSPDGLNVTVSLATGMSRTKGLFLEMFLTAELVFAIIMLAAEKHRATFLAPVGIGLALFVGELWGVYLTGGALNPARAFGPAVAIRSFEDYHWIYWLGPYLGGALAAGFYVINKVLKFEHVNPGQDSDGQELMREQSEKKSDAHRGADNRSTTVGHSDDSHGYSDQHQHAQSTQYKNSSHGQNDAGVFRSNSSSGDSQYALGRVLTGGRSGRPHESHKTPEQMV